MSDIVVRVPVSCGLFLVFITVQPGLTHKDVVGEQCIGPSKPFYTNYRFLKDRTMGFKYKVL